MAKGSIGTNTSTIIYVRRKYRKPRPSNCKLCTHSIWINGDQNLHCTVLVKTDINKKSCAHYSNGQSFKTTIKKNNNKKKKKSRK